MLRITVFYHLALLIAVVLLLDYFRRRAAASAFCHGAVGGLCAALLLGYLIGDFNCVFAVPVDGQLHYTPLCSDLRLFAQGLFIEGTLFLLGAAAILFRAQKKRFALAAALAAGLWGGVGIDALLWEPSALTVRREKIESEKITRPIRILFVTDIQADRIDDDTRRAFALIKKENADLILFGGDYLQYSRSSVVRENRPFDNLRGRYGLARNLGLDWNRFLREEKLTAPLGVWAVGGFLHEDRLAADWFAGTGVTFIGQSRTIPITDSLTLLALTASDCRAATEKGFRFPTLSPTEKPPFVVALGHVPSYALASPDADLLLAGHTHGGQVRIPFLGPIFTMTPGLPRSMASGSMTLRRADGSSNRLIVSNGVGMERSFAPRLRFACRPDFWVVDLVPKPAAAENKQSPK